MPSYHTITLTGRVVVNGRTVACPTCGADKGLVVHGHMGRPASIRCPRGHDGPAQRPFDHPDVIQTLLAHPQVR